ncbi:MAG: UDP-N-acetylglucosamine 2-epimerase (hydrolyzing) [Bacteroidaceae bacterium]|nr:UDP-N-acetylglucosamine 2-epimerase (hydrolyzing) [Bacteroidaceae bacterium]
MRKICVVTGTRAEYGLMSRLIRLINDSDKTRLQLIATNMHLSPRFGNTYQEIEADGIKIDKKVPIIDDNAPDTAVETLRSMSRALSGFAEAYAKLNPDLIVALGDRYEILAAATAALIERIPVAHLHGGEITEGAYDDAIRHSITKMSHLHFTSTEEYRRRVIQLGEQPERVFNVGALGVENIKKLPLMSKGEIEKEIDFKIDDNTILVTYHPVTLGNRTAKDDIDDFIAALEDRQDLRVIFTMPNSDTGGQLIVDAINGFVTRNAEMTKVYKSLGVLRYLSVMKQVAAVVGNSSSGLLEVPSFGIPTLNIGDRQNGRIAAESVYNCAPDKESVLNGLTKVLSKEFRELAFAVRNPYEKANTAEEIFKVISTYPLDRLVQKRFYNINN